MIWKSNLFNRYEQIIHGSISKKYGKLGFYDSPVEEIKKNRKKLAQENNFDYNSITMVNQVHGDEIIIVKERDKGNSAYAKSNLIPKADAMVTELSNITLVIKTADCVPLLFYDPIKNIIAAAHAGWKGTASNISRKLINILKNKFSVNPASLIVAMAPSISGQNYDITYTKDNRIEIFQDLFKNNKKVIHYSNGHIYLDLLEANRIQCINSNVKDSNIDISNICTFENSKIWASYRAGCNIKNFQNWTYICKKAV